MIALEIALDLTVDDVTMLRKLGVDPEWIIFVACYDDKLYMIHPDDLREAQRRGLVKRVLGR
jgi:ferredoxin-fold anticodon binding domain-containing protein